MARKRRWSAKSREARGYGQTHRRMREIVAKTVEAGEAYCARCGRLIAPGAPGYFGHSNDRLTWTGPEHRYCNRSAAARRGNKTKREQPRLEDFARMVRRRSLDGYGRFGHLGGLALSA